MRSFVLIGRSDVWHLVVDSEWRYINNVWKNQNSETKQNVASHEESTLSRELIFPIGTETPERTKLIFITFLTEFTKVMTKL